MSKFSLYLIFQDFWSLLLIDKHWYWLGRQSSIRLCLAPWMKFRHSCFSLSFATHRQTLRLPQFQIWKGLLLFSELIAIIGVPLRIGLVTWIGFSHFCFPATCRNVASTLASTCFWPYYLLCSHGHGLPGVHCVGQLRGGLDAGCAVDWVGFTI